MACRTREELVGKRFVSVKNEGRHRVSKISELEWRPGFIRAVSTRDTRNADFTALVEFDDTGWKCREYVKVHQVFLEFLIEHTLSWVERKTTNGTSQGLWPALCFRPVVDKLGIFRHSKRPVEFLSDRCMSIVDEEDITFYREGDEQTVASVKEYPEIVKLIKAWTDYQDGQKILLTTPTVLLGYRVEVYRTEGTTQWYTAVIKSYNHANKSLTLTDDTVLEEHNEDPALIQMHLIGDGVVDSILNGVDVGVAQRRRPRCTVAKQNGRDSSSIISINRGAAGHQILCAGTVNQAKQLSYHTSSISPSSVTTTTTTAVSGKGYNAKSRGVSAADVANSASDAACVKGQNQQKNQKQTAKRKSDPPPKAAKKPPVNKKKKDAVGEENVETGSSVCKHTCNVVVKRIEEETEQISQCKDKSKSKPVRFKEKLEHNRKSLDLDIVKDSELSDISCALVNSSKVHEDSLPNAGVICIDEKQAGGDVDIQNEQVKDTEDFKAANVSTKQSDKSQAQSSLEVKEVSENDDLGDRKSVCDVSIQCLDKYTSGLPSNLNDIIVASIASSDYVNKRSDSSPNLSKNEDVKNDILNKKADSHSCARETSQEFNTPGESKSLHNQQCNSLGEGDSLHQQECTLLDESKTLHQQECSSLGESKSLHQQERSPLGESKSLRGQECSSLGESKSLHQQECTLLGESNSLHQLECGAAVCSDSAQLKSEQDMHYKKQIIRAGGNSSPSRSSPASNSSEGIDLNRMVIDQLVKGKINDKYSQNEDGKSIIETADMPGNVSPSCSTSSHRQAGLSKFESNSLTKARDFSEDRQSAFICVQPSVTRSSSAQPAALDRADSRASDSQLPRHTSDEKLAGSRLDEIRSVRSSPGTSPLVSDRHESVSPYRDPELMRKNPVQSNIHTMLSAQHKISQPAFPSVHTPIPCASASAQPPAAFGGIRSLPARSLLSGLPYASAAQLPASISHHLALPHGYPMDAVVRAQQLAALQQHLMGYSLGTAPAVAALEALWQSKFPTIPIPAPYLLQKNQESLLQAELASAIHREQIQLQLNHERREFERIEVERRGRDKLEQELREKERKEILERDRQEKEKAERDKLERIEREQLEKERIERDRQEWKQKHNPERVLDPEAAVDRHFAESLTRLASQQGMAMFPSAVRGTGRGLVPKTEAHLPPHGLTYEKLYDHRTEVKRELESLTDEKPYVNSPDTEKSAVFAGYPYTSSGHHPGSMLNQGQKPFFSLYGYPSSHSTITPEQLKQRGLNPDPRQNTSAILHAGNPVHFNQNYATKDIKQELQDSVIVKREAKPLLKMENPVAAHSHHSSSSSSPRPQQLRPAHTPEHHRPDRPVSASAIPTVGIQPHNLHHSSTAPSVTSHLASSISMPFHSIDSHTRSQSPYKTAASQSQSQPLNFCKTAVANKLQILEPPPTVHSGYPSVAQAPVSLHSSVAYSYSLIQQGLVPNPIYSHIGSSHPSHSQIPQPSPHSSLDSRPAQLSPSVGKRKTGSKDSCGTNKKKSKGHVEIPVVSQPVSIPETTPQVFTNPSPYTTTESSNLPTNSVTSSVTASSPLPTITSNSNINSGFMDSFKSFVENTVQIAYFQDEKKALEKAERERLIAASSKMECISHERKVDADNRPISSCAQTIQASSNQDASQPNTLDSYSSRIMDTINRVANSQLDTDSDTLSASSPPPQIKPSDTNSPVSKSGNISATSHLHHMKKAWLQRHDEDKKSETPVPLQGEEDSNSSNISHSRDIVSCVENPSASFSDQGSSRSSPANVIVTLPNGLGVDSNNDESTSSASESELQNSSKECGPKKRIRSHKSGNGSSKKVRSDGENETTPAVSPAAFSNSSICSRIETENKLKEKSSVTLPESAVPSPSLHSDQSNPSPLLSESNAANMSPASSSSSGSTTKTKTNNMNKENRDKKKSPSKDGRKSISFNKPLVKMTVSILKKTMMPFLQDGPCSEITPKLNKCRECKMTPVQRSKKQPNIFCRFYAFRRLKYNSRGIVTIHGFSELSDADPDDIEPWLPRFPVEEPVLDVENSKFIIAKVGDKFCELVEQEREAKSWAGDNVNIVWKRAVVGVREMCDVCDTTLFNMHWVCHKCGFVVCLDCYEVRLKEGKKTLTDDKWLTCSSNRQAHKASEMMLTQIIPSDALWELGRLIHDIRIKWSIPSNCPCGGSNVENKAVSTNGINKQLLEASNTRKFPNGYGSDEHLKSKKEQDSNPLKNLDAYNPDTTSSPLSILAEVASMEPDSKSDVKRKAEKSFLPEDELLEESEKKSGCSTLRELLTKTAGKPKGANDKKAKKNSGLSTLDNIIQSVVEKSCTDGGAPFKFLHYNPRLGGWKRELPIMVHSLTETSVLYPDVPHSWLCDGRLLRLHDAHHKGNLQIFQEQWKRGQPVLVSCANKKMNINIWRPEVFSREFGRIENEVVNCRTGDVIIGHTMGDFWDGFEHLRNRPTDDRCEPMLLKLKDWPPGDDFSELLPSRFQDLMNALPLPEYTHRNGKLNLASRLPDFLVRPDLGPKMYNAYGSSQFPKEGTTNLHLDISDAVNVMVYVGIPGDGPGGRKAQEEAAVKAIDDAGCDSITKRRVREVHEIPGALWHIYDAHDADKIRDFLNKVAKERGEVIEKDHDAIHDQSWYLDKELCDRLNREYGVQGYTIVQCLGDAIFIPAGAPHQVRNLHSCIKVAEDFVSPEHLNHCFRLTQEFRQLSETHSNHEDKLQVKNIIYHAVKDAIAVLRENDPEDE